MKASWYEQQGAANDVLVTGKMDDPVAGLGEVRIRVMASGINPGDVKKRNNSFGVGMPYPRVIPHSDGAGVIDQVGSDVDDRWLGRRVWCYGAQSYRPFGTAAEYTVVPIAQAVPLPDSISFSVGATLGIPAMTAYQTIQVAGALAGKRVLVQGGAGAVGSWAVQLAHQQKARVIAVVRSDADREIAYQAGADEVLLTGEGLAAQIKHLAPEGVQHIAEVAFAANIELDAQVLAQGGSIASYATDSPNPAIPFWPLAFANARLFFIGSDDVPASAKSNAAQAINDCLVSGWEGLPIAEEFALEDIALAHEAVEHPKKRGRIILRMG